MLSVFVDNFLFTKVLLGNLGCVAFGMYKWIILFISGPSPLILLLIVLVFKLLLLLFYCTFVEGEWLVVLVLVFLLREGGCFIIMHYCNKVIFIIYHNYIRMSLINYFLNIHIKIPDEIKWYFSDKTVKPLYFIFNILKYSEI